MQNTITIKAYQHRIKLLIGKTSDRNTWLALKKAKVKKTYSYSPKKDITTQRQINKLRNNYYYLHQTLRLFELSSNPNLLFDEKEEHYYQYCTFRGEKRSQSKYYIIE